VCTVLILLAFTNGKMAADPDTNGEMVSTHFAQDVMTEDPLARKDAGASQTESIMP
jgi:hypothetical protein